MPRSSKLTEAQWGELLARDAEGKARDGLARAYGVSVGTIAWQARKRGRLKGLTEGAVDRRRRPEGGWPDGHVFRQGGGRMTPALWDEALTRYARGERVEALAQAYGFHPDSLAVRARALGRRKCDLPGAVYRSGRDAPERPRPEMAFRYDPDDLEVTRVSIAEVIARAMAEERTADAVAMLRLWGTAREFHAVLARVRGKGG